MSLIHLEKSVLSFHLREILEEGHVSHPLTWVGIGVLIFAPKFLSTLSDSHSGATPQTKAIRSTSTPLTLSQWVAQAKHRELEAQAAVNSPLINQRSTFGKTSTVKR